MKQLLLVLWLLITTLSMPGCTFLTPELIHALASDSASFCALSDVRGGAGALVMPAPSGGYGQGTLVFCRSNRANARLTVLPDGAISIEHGAGE
jgi:hypothetical protein